MDWRSPNRTTRKPLAGGYVVFYERPFPEKLDQSFRRTAWIAAVAFAIAADFWLTLRPRYQHLDIDGAKSLLAGALIAAGMAYASVRAVGLITVGLVQSFSRKQYVVAWQDDPASRP